MIDWIKCSEKLPELDKYVLVWFPEHKAPIAAKIYIGVQSDTFEMRPVWQDFLGTTYSYYSSHMWAEITPPEASDE